MKRGAAILALFLAACQSTAEIRRLKLAHGLDTNHPVHRAMEHMGERLERHSSGRLRLDIYPSGQLGEERALIELLQIGSVGLTKVSTAPLESFVPEYKIFGLPFLFRDQDHLWKTLRGPIGSQLLRAGERYYLRGLCYYDAGSRSFYTRSTPVRHPRDLEGLKIRVQKSITAHDMVRALGGAATPIDWGELYSALEQGVVDGAENNPPSFHTSRHYEVCRYYSLDEHSFVPDVVLVSTHVWNRLSGSERRWLQRAADESVEVQRRLWKEATELAFSEIEKAGVQVIRPDREPFRRLVERTYAQYSGTPTGELIERIRSLQE